MAIYNKRALGVAFILAACGAGANAYGAPDQAMPASSSASSSSSAPSAAQPAAVAQAVKTVQLSKVLLDRDSRPIKGDFRVGVFCFSNGPFKWNPNSGNTLNYERFDRLFQKEMTRDGYKTISSSQDLFAQANKDADSADFLVGATVSADTMDLCSAVGPQAKGTVILNIEFKIYDNNKKAVVDTVSVVGSAKYEKFQKTTAESLLDDAFVNGVYQLAASGKLNGYLGNPLIKLPEPPQSIYTTPPKPPADN